LSWQTYLPDHAVDLPDDEPVNPEPAPMIHHHAPTPPEGYIDDDDIKDDEENPDEDPEEEPIEQNNTDEFALHMNPQPVGNMNGWLIKDDDENVEEDKVGNEEMKVDKEDEDDGVDDNEDEAEVINAYEEVEPLNRPPPVTAPNGAWTKYVSGGVTLLSISSTKHKERPLR
nr:hypothetical protein [Tanacetum cinerariifolium]